MACKTRKVVMSVRVDAQAKERAERIFAELGTNMSTAVNMFLMATVREGGFPIELTRVFGGEPDELA